MTSPFKVAIFEAIDGRQTAVACEALFTEQRDNQQHAAGATRIGPWQDVREPEFPWLLLGVFAGYFVLGFLVGAVMMRYLA